MGKSWRQKSYNDYSDYDGLNRNRKTKVSHKKREKNSLQRMRDFTDDEYNQEYRNGGSRIFSDLD